MVHRVGVVAAEPVAPVIAAAAELRLAGDGLEFAGVGLEAEITAADIDDALQDFAWDKLRRLAGLDLPAGIAVGAVDPVVDAPGKAVDAMLLIAFLEAGEEDFLFDFAVLAELGVEE